MTEPMTEPERVQAFLAEQRLRDLKARVDEARDAFDNGDVCEDHSAHVSLMIRAVVRGLDELDRAIAEEGVECST